MQLHTRRLCLQLHDCLVSPLPQILHILRSGALNHKCAPDTASLCRNCCCHYQCCPDYYYYYYDDYYDYHYHDGNGDGGNAR